MHILRKKIAIIGAGPSSLLLAATLDERLYEVHLFEKNAAPARKFLVAGDGGFNLTHSENMDAFVQRYTPNGFLDAALRKFTNGDLRRFLAEAGIPTYAGTSGRVFPEKGIKPVHVLDAVLAVLRARNVTLQLRHRWTGWNGAQLLFETSDGPVTFSPDLTVFALGGGSWKVTGSDGSWTTLFAEKGIHVLPLQPSNCAVHVRWPKELIAAAEGAPLKNIAVRCGGKEKKGELVLTARGLEGGAVYFHSPAIRQQLAEAGRAEVFLDLRPDLTTAQVAEKLRGGKSRSEQLRTSLGLGKAAVALLKTLPKADFLDDTRVAEAVKSFPVEITGLAPPDDAISTAGGIAWEEVDADFRLKKIPHTFVIGEMLDWDAPTGGYLLQACFSMGYYLAERLNELGVGS